MAEKVWLKSSPEMLRSLLADEAKNRAMLSDMESTLRQLRSKSSFRLALINGLIDEMEDKQIKDQTNEHKQPNQKTNTN